MIKWVLICHRKILNTRKCYTKREAGLLLHNIQVSFDKTSSARSQIHFYSNKIFDYAVPVLVVNKCSVVVNRPMISALIEVIVAILNSFSDYRPQTKFGWGKVIFLHLSVILFTVWGGGRWYPSMYLGHTI